jgi:small subunit ribosomal protein S20
VPNIKSAKKRLRQSEKRRSINRWRRRRLKEQVGSFLEAVHNNDVPTAEAEFRKTCGLLDKISCTSTLHKNTASRRKSRLSRRLLELKQKAGA